METTTMKWPANLVIVRHAQSQRNVDKEEAEARGVLVYGRPGITDPEVALTQLGEQQALDAGKILASHCRFDTVFTSPYKRTTDTARFICSQFDYQPEWREHRGLREIEFGKLDGLTRHGLKARFPDEAARKVELGKYLYCPPGGESRVQVHSRVKQFLERLKQTHAGKNVLVVTHSVVAMLFRHELEGWTIEKHLLVDKEGDVPNCEPICYACRAHCEKGERLVPLAPAGLELAAGGVQ